MKRQNKTVGRVGRVRPGGRLGQVEIIKCIPTTWDIIFERLKKKQEVLLLIENIPVKLDLVANFQDFRLLIKPYVNGHFLPDFVKPLFHYESHPPGIDEILEKFYFRKEYITKLGRKNKKRNRQSNFDTIFYYWFFPNFKSLKKQYQKNFREIIILDSPIDSDMADCFNQLPGGIGNALPATMKALPAGEKG